MRRRASRAHRACDAGDHAASRGERNARIDDDEGCLVGVLSTDELGGDRCVDVGTRDDDDAVDRTMERRVDGGATNECDDGDDARVNNGAVDAWVFRARGDSARGVSRAVGFSLSSLQVECVFWRERTHLFKMNGIGDGTMANEVVLTDATAYFNAN